LNNRYLNILLIVGSLLITISACEFGAKEKHLGNNLYLSEYDCVDRRILHQTRKQALSGVEIVPMTVSEIDFNNNWIIAKTKDSKSSGLLYWIIKNSYDEKPTPEEIKENTYGPMNKVDFDEYVNSNGIQLRLKTIEC